MSNEVGPLGAEDEERFVASMKRLREENGWSQGEMARRMTDAGWPGFHQTTISRLEKGERPVRLGEARGIAQVLGTLVGQMILPTEEARSLRNLELEWQELKSATKNLEVSIHHFEVARQALQYELSQWDDSLLDDENIDEGIRERAKRFVNMSRRDVKASVVDVLNEYMEYTNDRVVWGGDGDGQHQEAP